MRRRMTSFSTASKAVTSAAISAAGSAALRRRPGREHLLLHRGHGRRALVLLEGRHGREDLGREAGLDLVHQQPVGTALFELHRRPADFGRPGADDRHLLLDGLVGDLEAGDDLGLVDHVATRLDHADGVGGAGDDQVDRALSISS